MPILEILSHSKAEQRNVHEEEMHNHCIELNNKSIHI